VDHVGGARRDGAGEQDGGDDVGTRHGATTTRPPGGVDYDENSRLGAPAPSAAKTPPVLLVHGFASTKPSWALVAHNLGVRGMTVQAMSYPPLGTSVEKVAERLIAEVERLLSSTAAEKVHLVGHSLGGVVIAHAITDRRLLGRVDTVITLGSPFGGSPWA
jgi:pimeloyl-ACP methyl ester carboxylesterase